MTLAQVACSRSMCAFGTARFLVLATSAACLVVLGACATHQRISLQPDTISVYRIVGNGDDRDPAVGPRKISATITLEELTEFGNEPGFTVEHLIDAPISAGAFSADGTAAVTYTAVNPDGSTSPAVAERRSGCRLQGTISGEGGVFVVSYDLYHGVVGTDSHRSPGAPPLMDSSHMVSRARITPGIPCIVGVTEQETTEDGKGAKRRVREAVYTVLALGPHR